MKKKSQSMPCEIAPYEEKATASFRLGKKMKLPKLVSGKRISVTVTGKVKGFRDEEYGRSFEVEIEEIETDRGMAGDLKEIKKKRTLLDSDED